MSITFSSCPLCGSPYRAVYSLPHADIVRCRGARCGLMFASTQPDDAELMRLYEARYYLASGQDGSHGSADEQEKFSHHARRLDSAIGLQGKRLLDFGSGAGGFLNAARSFGPSVLCGVEPHPRARGIAARSGLRVETELQAYQGETFDLIYVNDVIEHLRDPVEALRAMRAMLSPKGAIFVATMNTGGIFARIMRERWEIITEPTHLFFYDRKSLWRTLHAAGFERVKRQAWSVPLSRMRIARRMLHRVLVAAGLDSTLKVLAA